MALYRNVAGAEALGLARDYFTADTFDGGGGGGDYLLPDTGGSVPIRSVDPVDQSAPTVFFDPWFVPQVPPTIAPDPVVIQPPPDNVYVSPTGETIAPQTQQTVYPVSPDGVLQPTYAPVTLQNPRDNFPIDGVQTVTPSAPLPAETAGQIMKRQMWPLLTLAGALLVAVKGDDLFGEKRNIAFVGSIATLYYLMNRQSAGGTT